MAVGNYILFLDSHCEVNQQWLEPLLATMQQQNNPYVAVSPLLDQIEAESNVYQATADSIKGGFDWSLHFHWLPRKYSLKMKEKPFRLLKFFLCKFLLEIIFVFSFARYFRSPTFAGGIFLISRNWFFKLKAFNTHLEVSRWRWAQTGRLPPCKYFPKQTFDSLLFALFFAYLQKVLNYWVIVTLLCWQTINYGFYKRLHWTKYFCVEEEKLLKYVFTVSIITSIETVKIEK